ncbi:MAG: hypothetical protein LBJ68_00055 [Endomicrobium sp.]|jgi:heptosyltransferase-2|nr:hypothetical protein [Endomicrobium sp.]
MNQLGDLIFSLPVLDSVKRELNVETYSIIKQDLSPILTSSGLVDEIVPKEIKFIKKIRKKIFDKAIFFSESPKSLITSCLLKIREKIGFETSSLNFLLTRKVRRSGVPSLSNNRKLGFEIGLKTIHTDYTNILNVPQKNLDNVKEWFKKNNLNILKTIVISMNASNQRQDKCLKENRWIDVINVLLKKGLNCILSGTELEKKSLKKTAEKCKIKPKLFISKKNILDSAALFKVSSLFIGIDSGSMHLAAAVGTKCIGIFGRTDPLQTGPMPLKKHIIIKKNNITQITTEDIISKVKI